MGRSCGEVREAANNTEELEETAKADFYHGERPIRYLTTEEIAQLREITRCRVLPPISGSDVYRSAVYRARFAAAAAGFQAVEFLFPYGIAGVKAQLSRHDRHWRC